ncbi:hypothetical protein BLL42_28300 (plasmid) [Pseudomonas frederiksbergensis]|uniref:Uncharacterized protein n=1 Tax=Pseudomonas frederiksbergensis TaxID=104087 RepID=A0A1J0EUQ7_9PSED|nr:hypothetical protein BLL42_28300 [Pseudomonas frederiksbergensis]
MDCEALAPPNTLSKQVDITDRAKLLTAVAEAEERFGPVDALFNNAGVMLLAEITKQNPAEWDQMINANVKGLLNGVHAVSLEAMVSTYTHTPATLAGVKHSLGSKGDSYDNTLAEATN